MTPAPAEPPVYWQWRRKSQEWSLDLTFEYEVAVTTDDSEKRALYAAPPLRVEGSASEAATEPAVNGVQNEPPQPIKRRGK